MQSTNMSEVKSPDPALRSPVLTDILVVDDLPEKLLVYETVLEAMDLNIITARSGPDALREVLKREFAVILLDVSMPGMDGFETATLIRQRRRSSTTPIIFLTSFTDEVRMAQGYASGAVDYIATPVVPEILRAKVQVFVELFRMRRQSAAQAEERARRTEAEEAATRLAFLADAGKEMMRSFEFEPLLRTIADVPVPFLADLSALYVLDGSGKGGRIECVWIDPGSDGHEHKRSASGCSYPWLTEAFEQAMSTAQVIELKQLAEAASGGTENGSAWPPMQGGCALVVPLIVRSKVHGALALARRGPDPGYPPLTIALATELASRAALMLENALLVHGIQEADHRKDEFLGMLAHELRNPLAPLRNAVHILDMMGHDDGTLEQARDVIDRQVTHMTRLVDDLLDATRIARGKILLRKEHCDIAPIVRQTAADYRSIFETSGMLFKIEVPSAAVPVHGDPTRLAQAVGNLLHNAHKFTDPGGSVTLRLQTAGMGNWADIHVEDSGVGIEPAMLPYVFDVFRQAEQGLDRSRGGLGLGLTLVKGLVEMHGGTVEVERSEPGEGTAFKIRLPLDQEPPPPRHEQDDAALSNTTKYRILVIDDNRDAAESIKMLLQKEGHLALTAYTGPAGLESVHSFRPEVILCDIGLPGMDGYQIARSVRATYAHEPIHLIALTGYGRDEDHVRSREAGFDLHMTKPIDFTSLRRVLAGIRVNAR